MHQGPHDTGRRPLLVCFSHLRWNFVYQRPQHLLSQAARDYEVYFIEEPLVTKDTIPTPRLDLHALPNGVMVAVPILPTGMDATQVTRAQRELVNELFERFYMRPKIFWYYTPMALLFSRHLDSDVCVYDNMDELSAFKNAPHSLLTLEEELFTRCDMVFTGGQSLYEAKRARHHSVYAFPSSIDATHFALARNNSQAQPADQENIARPRLGFFGVIDERMDIELVDGLSRLRPDWQFVMIGPVVKIDPATLPQRPNIHWLSGKDYQELPAYLAHWDVGIMPFAINESTRFISPTKTPEFLAAGVPVVSTPIRDVVRPYGERGLVEIANTAEEFAAKAAQLMQRPHDAWLREVDLYLEGISWGRTWGDMNALLQRALKPRSMDRAHIAAEGASNV